MSGACVKVSDRPEIYLVVVPDERFGSGATNCYIVRSSGRTLVVDTGGPSEDGRRIMECALREVGARPETTEFFLTHLHIDHSGLLSAVAREGAVVRVGGAEMEASRAMDDPAVAEEMERRIVAQGTPRDEAREYLDFRLGIDRIDGGRFDVRAAEAGDVVSVGEERFEVLDTSGHAPGHRSLFHRESGVLIGGDHVLFITSPYVSFYPGLDDRLGRYLERLRAVRGTGVRRLLQAHGRLRDDADGTAFDDRVEWLVSHRERRVRECAETIARMPGATGREILRAMPSSARIDDWASAPMVRRWCVVANGMAVLDHVARTGRAEAFEGADGLDRYRLSD